MVFFRCTVGGSGKGNTVTVTCAEEFAGLTITLSKTGKTYTKTCPSTSPYVVTFYSVENGTYLVSGTVDGRTYSETVIVQDISCVLSYGFNWRLWVNTASQLDSSDYDSLDEVLEDEKALRELFLEHACVDYMAESDASNEALQAIINNDLCAKWINLSDYALDYLYANEVIADLMDEADKYFYGEWALMPQVPKMTSNTAPYGTVSASAANSNYEAYKAFDSSDSTGWHTSSAIPSGEEGNYVQYDFGTQKKIKEVLIKTQGSSSTAFKYTNIIKVSVDGTTFTEIERYTTDLIAFGGTIVSHKIQVNANCRYIRLYSLRDAADSNVSAVIMEIQAYAWAPKGNVPVMTSNTAPYGEAIRSRVQATGNEAFKVFDNDSSTSWMPTNAVPATTDYIGYRFTNPIIPKKVRIERAQYNTTQVVALEGSNDNSTWVAIDENISMPVNERITEAVVTTSTPYLYLRTRFVSQQSTSIITYASLQFYGRELKVSVPIMTSNTAPYGEVLHSTEYNTQYGWTAFNGKSPLATGAEGGTDGFYVYNQATPPYYIGYDFGENVKIKKVYYQVNNLAGTGNQRTHEIDVQYYDNDTWKTIDDSLRTMTQTSTQVAPLQVVDCDVNTSKIRLHKANDTADNTMFRYVQFYGLDYSEKEFEAGTTKKWLYDHGVELEELVYGSSVEKEDSQIVCIGNSSDALKSVVNTLNIDLTPYNLIRVVLGNRIVPNSGNNNCGSWFVSNQDNIQWNSSTWLTYKDIPVVIDNPNTFNLNISSVNASKKFGVGTAANAERRNSFKELWLE